MSEITIINSKVKFFETFKVETDSLASQTLEYMPGTDSFVYHDVDVYGETAIVRIMNDEGENVLELENVSEDELITELATLFAELDYNQEAFVKKVHEKYTNTNLI